MTATTLPPVMQRLIDQFGATRIEADTLAAFLDRPGTSVLLLAGDPVAPDSQDAVARRYGSQRWPSLVFLRDGQYVTTLAGMHDWTDYLKLVEAALAMPVSRAPTIGIPVVSANASTSCH